MLSVWNKRQSTRLFEILHDSKWIRIQFPFWTNSMIKFSVVGNFLWKSLEGVLHTVHNIHCRQHRSNRTIIVNSHYSSAYIPNFTKECASRPHVPHEYCPPYTVSEVQSNLCLWSQPYLTPPVSASDSILSRIAPQKFHPTSALSHPSTEWCEFSEVTKSRAKPHTRTSFFSKITTASHIHALYQPPASLAMQRTKDTGVVEPLHTTSKTEHSKASLQSSKKPPLVSIFTYNASSAT